MSKQVAAVILKPVSHIENTFKVSPKIELFYQAWLPDYQANAVVVLVHGLADHSSRYGNVVNHLLPKGFAIWNYDQRGHGRSPGKRCYTSRFTDLVNDLDKFVTLVKQQNPELPLFIIGHSLGALESVSLVAKHQPQGIAGLVVSGLVLKIGQSVPQIMLSLAGVISVLAPRLGVQHLDCNAISSDDSVVEGYVKDPLVHTGKIPARMVLR
ncbi:lysophospholipase/monoglyceride lipase-like protein [Dehalogenimonas sp. WBC-2]|nr:lysophospholipase/monoglyceride lipase-like protein [Dehalogenimonas sp. WBC-2]